MEIKKNIDESSNLLKELSALLKKYEKIFIFDTEDETIRELLKAFYKKTVFKNIFIMVISYGEKEQSDKFKSLSRNEYNYLERIYNMYEFSDKVHILSKSTSYGGILNYVETGLLTEDEVIEALLY